jgi:hypothetical protein
VNGRGRAIELFFGDYRGEAVINGILPRRAVVPFSSTSNHEFLLSGRTACLCYILSMISLIPQYRWATGVVGFEHS